MEIMLNNRKEIFEGVESLSMKELLEKKSFSYKMLIIKHNGNTIKKDAYESTQIKDGDEVSVLHLMSGG